MDKSSNAKDLKDKVERGHEWSKKIEWSEVSKSWIEYFKIF
jgi:hypothetical protein